MESYLLNSTIVAILNGTDLSNLCLAQRRKDAKEARLSYRLFQ